MIPATPTGPTTFAEAARTVLTQAGAPLHYRDITQRALSAGLLQTTGATPAETLNARVAVDIQRHGEKSMFVRLKPGVFGLAAWGLQPEPAPELSARGTHLPTWTALRGFLTAVDGKPRENLTALRVAIRALRGEGKDFTQPDAWLHKELDGEAKAMGLALWTVSGKTLNPRYVAECASLASRCDLVEEGDDGVLRCTPSGKGFLSEPQGLVTRHLDAAEGVARVLALVAQFGPARAGELLGPYTEWCAKQTGLRSEATVRVSLGSRLGNLAERGLVLRNGQAYGVTPAGLSWLEQEAQALVEDDSPEDQDELFELIREINEQQQRIRERIRAAVSSMHHTAFEHLIKRLLDAMGYFDVEVTPPSGDRGIDVVGRIKVGITPVTEVIQAKRQQGNVGRPVLDALRGSLHRWSAQRGTIITTASFSKGARDAAFEKGTYALQLIDGEELVNLLVQHQIGLKEQAVKLWRFDPEPFASPSGVGAGEGQDDE
ncbi:MAG: restriction endonuclease [Pseudomonadota bacterium]|nr:restriction endonuclease [Pseudomonadota bacterium]